MKKVKEKKEKIHVVQRLNGMWIAFKNDSKELTQACSRDGAMYFFRNGIFNIKD